jgi:hypothetical protein
MTYFSLNLNMQNINLIYNLIKQNVAEKQQKWVDENVANYGSVQIAFVAAPRFVGKQKINNGTLLTSESIFQNWTIDRLVRVYFLLILEKNNTSEVFLKQMEILFETAEINESVALFSALPFLQNPQLFNQQATDAVRSNIGDIFDSIAFGNAYPSKYFSELAWNQLIMKSIFNNKSIHRIIGLENRSNENLANILSDFAHERWAAGRSVPAQVWRLVVNFVTDTILKDIEVLFQSESENNNIAAVLVCQESINPNAKDLLTKYYTKNSTILIGKLNWKYLENNE